MKKSLSYDKNPPNREQARANKWQPENNSLQELRVTKSLSCDKNLPNREQARSNKWQPENNSL